ncbi:MAG: hypothetical protein M3341_03155 [Actinomycetota bacterium]|nr:hypothetical protein [Actinomycetota bacterium]
MDRGGQVENPDESRERADQARLLGGRISCLVGMLLGVGDTVLALVGGSPGVSSGAVGIGLGIVGFLLGARRLALVTVVGVAALFFAVAASAGLVPGLEPAGHGYPG